MAMNPDDNTNSGCISRNAVGTLRPNKAVDMGERYRLKYFLFQGNDGTVRAPSITETEAKAIGGLRSFQG